MDSPFRQLVQKCTKNASRVFLDDHMPDGTAVRSMARRVAVNPVTGTVAIALAVLSVTGADESRDSLNDQR